MACMALIGYDYYQTISLPAFVDLVLTNEYVFGSNFCSEADHRAFLLTCDPKNWKHQDHYKVLGLDKLRYFASTSQIKEAYRRMVLRHHPDKRQGSSTSKTDDDDYYTCITRAYEVLSNATSRRSFDSCDPEFDDDIPELVVADAVNESDFYEKFGVVFQLNSRWSAKRPVPLFG